MTSATVLLAAILAAWGPVWPTPETPAPETSEPVAPAAADAVPAASAPAAPAIITRGPLDVRARPTLVATARPAPEPSKPLHKHWGFWVIAGGVFVAVVTAAIIANRPTPEAYRGNAPPYYQWFP